MGNDTIQYRKLFFHNDRHDHRFLFPCITTFRMQNCCAAIDIRINFLHQLFIFIRNNHDVFSLMAADGHHLINDLSTNPDRD